MPTRPRKKRWIKTACPERRLKRAAIRVNTAEFACFEAGGSCNMVFPEAAIGVDAIGPVPRFAADANDR